MTGRCAVPILAVAVKTLTPNVKQYSGKWAISSGVGSPHPQGENPPTRVRRWPRKSGSLLGGIDCCAVELLCGLGADQSAPLGTGDVADPGLYRRDESGHGSAASARRGPAGRCGSGPLLTQPKETSLTKKLTLSTRVALDQGHALFAPTPDWTGSTEQFWAANPADPLREMNDFV
jgi:hypothetical protein